MNITAKELSGLHVGEIVGVKMRREAGEELEPLWLWGTLSDVHHSANLISEARLCDNRNSYTIGMMLNHITVITSSETMRMTVDPDTPIIIQEGQ